MTVGTYGFDSLTSLSKLKKNLDTLFDIEEWAKAELEKLKKKKEERNESIINP